LKDIHSVGDGVGSCFERDTLPTPPSLAGDDDERWRIRIYRISSFVLLSLPLPERRVLSFISLIIFTAISFTFSSQKHELLSIQISVTFFNERVLPRAACHVSFTVNTWTK
jgi:hypothetical protein